MSRWKSVNEVEREGARAESKARGKTKRKKREKKKMMIGEKMRQRGASISLGRDLSHADVMPPSPALSAITVPGVRTKDHSWILTEPGVGA